MTAYRYWRLLFTDTQSGAAPVFASLVLRETPISGVLTGTGTAISSGDVGGYPASNLYDNDEATSWQSSNPVASSWVGYDFGAGGEVDVGAVAIVSRDDGGDLGASPRTGVIQTSSNGTDWDDRFFWEYAAPISSHGSYYEGALTTVEPAGPHRYWRVLILGNSANVASVGELQFRETEGGADTTFGKTVITSGSWTGASNAFDDTSGTFAFTAAAASRSSPYAIGVDYGVSSGDWKDIVEVAVSNGNAGTSQGPTNMVVQYSDNNTDWTFAWSIVVPDWGSTITTVVSAKADNREGRVVFDTASPPTDSGPHAVTLTAAGNATVSGGRFVFDGTGDYYSNTSVPADVHRVPYKFTLEIDQLKATNSGFNGVVNIGDNSARLLVTEDNGSLTVWEDGSARIVVAGVVNNTTGIDVRVELTGTALRLYIDNVLRGAGIFTRGIIPNDIYLGTDPADASGRSMNGGFSRVRILHGASPIAAGKRYWRVRNIFNRSNQTGIGTLEMAEAAGGPNLCVGGTPIASGSYGGGYSPSSAFDGNLNSNWFQSGAGSDRWLGYDFGAGVAPDINEIRMGPGSEDNNGYPRLFHVESSSDGSTWSFEWVGGGVSISGSTKYNYPRPPETPTTAVRYWMLMVTELTLSGSNRDAAIAEMELLAGGTDQTGSGTADATNWAGGYEPAKAFDNNNTTAFYHNTGNYPALLYYDLGFTPSLITQFSLRAMAADGYNNQQRAPEDAVLYASDNGRSWFQVHELVNEPVWSGGEKRTYDFVFDATDTVGIASAIATGSAVGSAVDPGETVGTASAAGSASGNLALIGTLAATGTATGTGAAAAVGFVVTRAPTVGTAAGVGSASAQVLTQGINNMTGQASSLGTALGNFTAFVPRAGVAVATSNGNGQIIATGTLEMTGAAAGTSASFSGSAATGVLNAAGEATGTSAGNGVGTGRQEYVGAASGAATAVAAGSYAPTLTVARASGLGMAIAAGQRISRNGGEASGVGVAAARAVAIFSGVGAASTTSAGWGRTGSTEERAASASATSTAAAAATGLSPTAGAAAALLTADGVGAVLAPARAAAAATSNALGVSNPLLPAVGSATSSSAAQGRSEAGTSADGSAAAAGAANATALRLLGAVGGAAGGATVSGASVALATVDGRAVTTSNALGISDSFGPGVDMDDVLPVDADDWLIVVPEMDLELIVVAADDALVVVSEDGGAALAA